MPDLTPFQRLEDDKWRAFRAMQKALERARFARDPAERDHDLAVAVFYRQKLDDLDRRMRPTTEGDDSE